MKRQGVVQIDKHTGKVIAKYESIRAAAVALGLETASIQRQLAPDVGRPRTSKAAKYRWLTLEKYNELKSLGFLKERRA